MCKFVVATECAIWVWHSQRVAVDNSHIAVEGVYALNGDVVHVGECSRPSYGVVAPHPVEERIKLFLVALYEFASYCHSTGEYDKGAEAPREDA